MLNQPGQWRAAPRHFRAIAMDEQCTFFARHALVDEGAAEVLAEVRAGRFKIPIGTSAVLITMNRQAWALAQTPVMGTA